MLSLGNPKGISSPLTECFLDGVKSDFWVLHRNRVRQFSSLWRHKD